MRKIKVIMIVLLLVTMISSCGKENANEGTSSEKAGEEVTREDIEEDKNTMVEPTPSPNENTPTPIGIFSPSSETKFSQVVHNENGGISVVITGQLSPEEMPVGSFYWSTITREQKELPMPPEDWFESRLMDRYQIGDNAWYESYQGFKEEGDESLYFYGRITGTGATWNRNGEIRNVYEYQVGARIDVDALPDKRFEKPYLVDVLVIEEGITELGDFSLILFDFDEIYFPTTLKKIGKAALSKVYSVREFAEPCDEIREGAGFNLPENVEIDEYAFACPVNYDNWLDAVSRRYYFYFDEYRYHKYPFMKRYEDEAIALHKELFPEYNEWEYSEKYGREILIY